MNLACRPQPYWKPSDLFSPTALRYLDVEWINDWMPCLRPFVVWETKDYTKGALRICEPTLQTRCRNLTNLLLIKRS